MPLNCGVGEDSWESLRLQGDPTSPFWRRSVLGVHWKDWCWSWNYNTFATWCEELTHLKRPWCWERLRAGGEGNDREWDGWMASPTQWTWVWVDSGSWWSTGRPGVLRSMGLQRVGHDWATELTELIYISVDDDYLMCCVAFLLIYTLQLINFKWYRNCDTNIIFVCLLYLRKNTHKEFQLLHKGCISLNLLLCAWAQLGVSQLSETR